MNLSVNITNVGIHNALEITSPNWDGKILKMSKKAYDEWRKKGDVPETAAVYALYVDHFDRSKFGNELYIGHTAKIDQRLDQHVAQKDYWTVVAIFISSNDWMNVAYTQNIEHTFIKWAKLAGRYDVKNGNDSAITHLGIDDRKRLDAYLSKVQNILQMVGIDIFQMNMDALYEREARGYGNTKLWSGLRVVDPKEKILEIMANSKIPYLDQKIVLALNLAGVIYDANTQSHEFTKNVQIKCENEIGLRICGQSLHSWTNSNGVSIVKILN